MSKTQEAIFHLTPTSGKFRQSEDFTKYLLENEGIEQRLILKQSSKISEKEKLYGFLFGPLMASAVQGFTNAGHNGVDKVTARYILEAEFCKCQVYNPIRDTIMTHTEHVSGMSKARLLKYVVDIIFYLELELGQSVPDSEEFKMQLKSGKEYKRIK